MQNLYILEKGIQAESMRRKIIADNIANANVPHFKRSELNFETELRQVLDEAKKQPVNAYITNTRHIPFVTKRNLSSVEPRVHLDYNTGYHNNGNNVDPEKELTLAAKNQMRYNLFVQYIDQKFRVINGVMKPPV